MSPSPSGLDNAGKSTILNKFNGEAIDAVAPTLGFNIKTLEYRSFKLNVWDVGGQQTIRSYWRNYYEQTDGLMFVIDSADQRRMEVREHIQTDKQAWHISRYGSEHER